MLRLDLRKYKDAYTLVNEIITVTDTNNDSRQNKKLVFKNNATFISCTEKNNNTFLDNAKDLDIVILMYNLLRHSGNYSITLGSMWHYQSNKANDDANENDASGNYRINYNNATASKSFEDKTKITRSTSSDNSTPVHQTQK